MPTNNTENIYSTEFENDPNPIPSSKVGYDNTESGLEATTVQDAIDELDEKIKASDEASEIDYDNTESGLDATNVQGAIDEIVQKANAPLPCYVIKEVAHNKTIATLENKTINDLIHNNELYTHINNFIHSIANDERLVITGIDIGNFANNVVEQTSWLFKNTDGVPIIHVINNSHYSNAIHNRVGRIYGSQSSFFDLTAADADGTTTVTDLSTSSEAVEKVSLSYVLYKVMENENQ